MAGEHGIKETKEALLALVALGGFVAGRLKDGVDLGDISALINKLSEDAEFIEKIQAGLDGLSLVDDEIKEIDLQDGLELVMCIPELLEELEKAKNA